jgi:hypothetical protein
MANKTDYQRALDDVRGVLKEVANGPTDIIITGFVVTLNKRLDDLARAALSA